MCLDLTKAEIAREDITCYKIVRFVTNDYVLTPLRDMPIMKEELSGERNFTSEKTRMRFWINESNGRLEADLLNGFGCLIGHIEAPEEVSEGFIHCYGTLKDVALDWAWWQRVCDKPIKQPLRLEVYRCVIPKGTLVCYGKFGGTDSLSAEQIRFVEKIDFYSTPEYRMYVDWSSPGIA